MAIRIETNAIAEVSEDDVVDALLLRDLSLREIFSQLAMAPPEELGRVFGEADLKALVGLLECVDALPVPRAASAPASPGGNVYRDGVIAAGGGL